MTRFGSSFEKGGGEGQESQEQARERRLRQLRAEEMAELKRKLKEKGLGEETIAAGMENLRVQAQERAERRLAEEQEQQVGDLTRAQERELKARRERAQRGEHAGEEAIVIGETNSDTEELLREEQRRRAEDPYAGKSADETAEEYLRRLREEKEGKGE